MLSRAHQMMDANGDIADAATGKLLNFFLQGFATFVERTVGGP